MRVRGQDATSTLSKRRKAFQQAERRPLFGAEMWPSRRTASFRSARDGYCLSSSQLCLASARLLMVSPVSVACVVQGRWFGVRKWG